MMEEHGLDFADARRGASPRRTSSPRTRRSRPATTCSPRAACEHYFARYSPQLGHRPWNEFLGLGRQNPRDANEALLHDGARPPPGQAPPTASASCTARSRRKMWKRIWPELPESTRSRSRPSPTACTPRSWISREMRAPLRPLPRRRTGTRSRPITAIWERVERHPRRRAVAHRTSGGASGWWSSPAQRLRAPARSAAASRRREIATRRARCSIPRR